MFRTTLAIPIRVLDRSTLSPGVAATAEEAVARQRISATIDLWKRTGIGSIPIRQGEAHKVAEYLNGDIPLFHFDIASCRFPRGVMEKRNVPI